MTKTLINFHNVLFTCFILGTDINNALLEAASEFDDDSSTFDAIIFMTDGVPSVGETSPDVILESVTNAIDGNAVLFCIGFGADVDEQLLYRLAVRNQGVYRRVTNEQHAASQMEGFFQEVASPLLYNVRVTYGEEAIPSETLTQSEFVSIFNGKEIIIAGKISDDFNGPAVVGLLNANSADGLINVPVSQDIAEVRSELRKLYLLIHTVLMKYTYRFGDEGGGVGGGGSTIRESDFNIMMIVIKSHLRS